MKYILVALTVGLLIRNNKCNADCLFENYDPVNTPIFIQNVSDVMMFIRINEGNLTFPNSAIAYCPSNFNFSKNEDNLPPGSQVSLVCRGDEVIVTYDNNTITEMLSCQNAEQSEVFQKFHYDKCNGDLTYFVAGLNVSGDIMHLAESCFDLQKMRLQFVHYIARSASPALDTYVDEFYASKKHSMKSLSAQVPDYIQLKPRYDQPRFTTYKKTEVPPYSYFMSDQGLQTKILKNFGVHSEFVSYNFTDLLPNNIFDPYIIKPFIKFKLLQRFVGWKNLIAGNWKTFKELLQARASRYIYDVYLGMSDTVKIPGVDSRLCANESVPNDIESVEMVPKVIWAYLNSKSLNEDFVVIGMNSPYYESASENLCTDICDKYAWLDSMKTFRKLKTFGYFYCCEKEIVENQLDGFPMSSNKMTKALNAESREKPLPGNKLAAWPSEIHSICV